MTRLIASLLLLSPVPAYADDYRQIVEAAFASVSQDYHLTWAFTETEMSDDETVVGRYDPRNSGNARWTLLFVDDREPTPEEIADYQEDKRDEFQEEDSEFEIVNLDSIKLIEETDERWLFGFAPNLDEEEDKEGKKFMREVVGQLAVSRGDNNLMFLDLHIEKPVRPAFSVKISHFKTRLEFGPAAVNGPTVLMSVDVEIRGRAMLAFKIDEIERIRLNDYQYVGP